MVHHSTSEADAPSNVEACPQLGRGHLPIWSLSIDNMIDIVTSAPGNTTWLQLCLVTTLPGFRVSAIAYRPAMTCLLPGAFPNSPFKNVSKIYRNKPEHEQWSETCFQKSTHVPVSKIVVWKFLVPVQCVCESDIRHEKSGRSRWDVLMYSYPDPFRLVMHKTE